MARNRLVGLAAAASGGLAALAGLNRYLAAQVGPLIAEDDAVARALLAHAVDAIEGPVFIDLADAKSKVTRFLEGRGFSAQRPFTRMLYSRSQRYDDAARTFAVVGPEFG